MNAKKMENHSKRLCRRYSFVSWTILFFLCLSLLTTAGCVRKPQNPFAKRNSSIFERLNFKKKTASKNEETDSLPQRAAELVFKADGHIQSLRLSPDSRRAIVERNLKGEDLSGDYQGDFAQQGALAEESPFNIGVELWNIEFTDSRLENFSSKRIGLLSSTLSSAAFDETGERLFWTSQESVAPSLAQSFDPSNAIVRGAAQSDLELPLYLPPETGAENELDPSTSGPTSTGTPPAENAPLELAEDNTVPATQNVVLTRPLDQRAMRQEANGNYNPVDDEVKHMKTADETKTAKSVWLSPGARWLVCREPASLQSDDQKNEELDSNWALVLLKERQRVVRFPATVKMTFDNATSDETIEGKIVDVLDVSDKGDLVATLVEEQVAQNNPPISADSLVDGSVSESKSAGVETALPYGAPRYKIVIWDLNVARTVDFAKAKKPLMALEVSQIAVAAPIPRKFCKFSPAGERFAAREEPRYITIWQSASGKRVVELGEHSDVIRDFAFAPRSAKMVVGVGGKNAQIVLWEIRKGVVHRTLDDVIDNAVSIDAVAFGNDENFVYFANNFGEVKRWNIRSR